MPHRGKSFVATGETGGKKSNCHSLVVSVPLRPVICKHPLVSIPSGDIAVSPDGNTIAYFGHSPVDGSPSICYYHNIDGVNYSFHYVVFPALPGTSPEDFNSLQFIYNSITKNYDLFFLTPGADFNVYHLIYEEAYCVNPNAALYPESFEY